MEIWLVLLFNSFSLISSIYERRLFSLLTNVRSELILRSLFCALRIFVLLSKIPASWSSSWTTSRRDDEGKLSFRCQVKRYNCVKVWRLKSFWSDAREIQSNLKLLPVADLSSSSLHHLPNFFSPVSYPALTVFLRWDFQSTMYLLTRSLESAPTCSFLSE